MQTSSRKKAPEWFGGSRSEEHGELRETKARRNNRVRKSKVHPSTQENISSLSSAYYDNTLSALSSIHGRSVGSTSAIDSPPLPFQMQPQQAPSLNDKREPSSESIFEEQTSIFPRTCAPQSVISARTVFTEPTFIEGYSDDEFLTYSDDESTTSDHNRFLNHDPFHANDLHAICSFVPERGVQVGGVTDYALGLSDIKILSLNYDRFSITGKDIDDSISQEEKSNMLPQSRSRSPSIQMKNQSAFTGFNRPPRPTTPLSPTTSLEQQPLIPKRRDDRKTRKSRYYTDELDPTVKDEFGPSILDSDYRSSNRHRMHDKAFLIVFILHLILVTFIAFRFGGLASIISTSSSLEHSGLQSFPSSATSIKNETNIIVTSSRTSPPAAPFSSKPDIHVDFRNAIYIALSSAIYSTSLTFLTVVTMIILNKSFIQSSLCFAVVICFIWGAVGTALSPYSFIPIIGIIVVVLSIAYVVVVWDRIPLATVNLNTALSGIRSSMDLIIYSYIMMVLAIIWTILWTFASLGLYDFTLKLSTSPRGFGTFQDISLCVSMALSYAWTMNVILNIIQVATTAVVSIWWTYPGRISVICSDAGKEAFHAVLSSFGSICYGSLVLPSFQVLRVLFGMCSYNGKKYEQKRNDTMIRENEAKALSFQESISAVNEFGITVVGMSDVDFISAGKKSNSIFRSMDWTNIVFDKLVPNVLLIATLCISFSAGCLSLLVEEFDGYSFTNFRKPMFTAFLIGSWIGFVASSVLMKTVGSAVLTVVICYAVVPYHFDQNHPSLSQHMRTAWAMSISRDVRDIV